MVWPLVRSKGGSNSSVAALIAVEMNALISAASAAPAAASSATMIARARMTIPPIMPRGYRPPSPADSSRAGLSGVAVAGAARKAAGLLADARANAYGEDRKIVPAGRHHHAGQSDKPRLSRAQRRQGERDEASLPPRAGTADRARYRRRRDLFRVRQRPSRAQP